MSDPASVNDLTGMTALKVLSFESRRSEEMRQLIERHGAIPLMAPSMREVPLEENPDAFRFGESLFAGENPVVVFMTGVGAAALLEILCTRWARDEILRELNQRTIVIRGPKPAVVLKDWGIRIDHRAPEPNTWRELLATMIDAIPLSGTHIAIQEYGKPNQEFTEELKQHGAIVQAVPVYRWALPENVEPLRQGILATIAGNVDVLMFTSAQQFHNILEVAAQTDSADRWMESARRCVVASIGPTATETLESGGLRVDIQPAHPKMGPLVREAIENARPILAARRS